MRCRFKHFALCLSVVTFALVILMRILHAPPLTPAERLQIRRDVDALNCSLLMAGSRTEQTKAYQIARRYRPSGYVVTDAEYERLAQNCSAFVRDYGYAQKKVTKEELEFPIAYGMLVYTDLELMERLLRAIYRPQNIYCFHLDKKAPLETRRALLAISACFKNVFVSKKSYEVTWGTISIVYAELECMREVLKYRSWRYFINLTGQEYPLKTNLEIVRILKAYNGTNDVVYDFAVAELRSHWFAWYSRGWYRRLFFWRSWQPSPTPDGMRLARGSTFMFVSHAFVRFVMQSPLAARFLHWMETNQVHIPDELFFNTLNGNPQLGVPGAPPKGSKIKMGLARAFFFIYKDNGEVCGGHVIRDVCNFGVTDLPRLAKAPQLFANKFRLDYEPVTYRCMEKWLQEKERMIT